MVRRRLYIFVGAFVSKDNFPLVLRQSNIINDDLEKLIKDTNSLDLIYYEPTVDCEFENDEKNKWYRKCRNILNSNIFINNTSYWLINSMMGWIITFRDYICIDFEYPEQDSGTLSIHSQETIDFIKWLKQNFSYLKCDVHYYIETVRD